MNYESYHTHPVNKGIHIMAIPTIVFSSYNLLSLFQIGFKIKNTFEMNIGLHKLLMYLMLYNYLSYGIKSFLVMNVYFYVISKLSKIYMKNVKNSVKISMFFFVYSWILQFIGHIIEGSRPALLDGIVQSFTQAPLFSLNYILPFEVY